MTKFNNGAQGVARYTVHEQLSLSNLVGTSSPLSDRCCISQNTPCFSCFVWVKAKFCTNPFYKTEVRKEHCAKSCGLCGSKDSSSSSSEEDSEKKKKCKKKKECKDSSPK